MSDEEIILTQEQLDAIEAERVLEEARIAEEIRIEEARVESERIIEVARLLDLKDRYKALKDHRAASAALGISNADLHFKQICEDSDKVKAEADMVELESIDSEEHVKASFVPYTEARQKEYRSIEEVMHVILDHGLHSEEFYNLQLERTQVKIRNPKN